MRKIALKNVPVDRLRPNPFQPRGSCDEKELERLAESIRGCGGIIEPIAVRLKDGYYEIACGHRRWLAAKKLAERTVPAVVCEISDAEMLQTVLVENLQRQNLNPLEEAKCLATLNRSYGMTHGEIGQKIGKTEDFVTQRIRLLSLPHRIRVELSRDRISPSVAEAIAAKPPETQTRILAFAKQGYELTVRQVSEFVDNIGTAEKKKQMETWNAFDSQPLSPEAYAASTVKPSVRLTRGVWAYYKIPYANAHETIAQFVHRILLTYFVEKGHPLTIGKVG